MYDGVPFSGKLVKLRLKSNALSYGPVPEPDAEVEQKLEVSVKKKTARLSCYNFGNGAKYLLNQVYVRRESEKDIRDILAMFEAVFSAYEPTGFFCGVAGTPLPMTKSRMQMSEYLDKMLAKREKVVIAAESSKKMTALAAMYASERGYSFIPVTNDDLPTYLSKQQQKGCVVFEGVADEREIESAYRKLRIPLRHCRLEGA